MVVPLRLLVCASCRGLKGLRLHGFPTRGKSEAFRGVLGLCAFFTLSHLFLTLEQTALHFSVGKVLPSTIVEVLNRYMCNGFNTNDNSFIVCSTSGINNHGMSHQSYQPLRWFPFHAAAHMFLHLLLCFFSCFRACHLLTHFVRSSGRSPVWSIQFEVQFEVRRCAELHRHGAFQTVVL